MLLVANSTANAAANDRQPNAEQKFGTAKEHAKECKQKKPVIDHNQNHS
jgi:hypothetical protein